MTKLLLLLRVLHDLMTIVGKAEDEQMLPSQLMRAAADEDGGGGMEVGGEGLHCLLPPRFGGGGEDVEEEVRVSGWVGAEGEEDDMVVGLSLGCESDGGGWSGEAGGRGGWRRVGRRGKKWWQRGGSRGGGGNRWRRRRQRSREVERGRGRRRREGRDVGKSGQRESWSWSGRGRGRSQEGRRGGGVEAQEGSEEGGAGEGGLEEEAGVGGEAGEAVGGGDESVRIIFWWVEAHCPRAQILIQKKIKKREKEL